MADEENQPEQTEPGDLAPGPDGTAAMSRTVDGGMRLQFSFDMPVLPKLDTIKEWSHQALINAGLIAAVGLVAAVWIYGRFFGSDATSMAPAAGEHASEAASPVMANIASDYNPTVDTPAVAAGAFVHPAAEVAGNITIGSDTYIGANVIVDSWAGQPMNIGSEVNIQAGTVISAQPTFVRGRIVESAFAPEHDGKFAVYIGDAVSVATGAQIRGPVAIEEGAYVGTGAVIAEATIGAGSVIEPGALVVGVAVPAGRYVAAGSHVLSQAEADSLPEIDAAYAMANTGKETVAFFKALVGASGGGTAHDSATSAPAATGEKSGGDAIAGGASSSAHE